MISEIRELATVCWRDKCLRGNEVYLKNLESSFIWSTVWMDPQCWGSFWACLSSGSNFLSEQSACQAVRVTNADLCRVKPCPGTGHGVNSLQSNPLSTRSICTPAMKFFLTTSVPRPSFHQAHSLRLYYWSDLSSVCSKLESFAHRDSGAWSCLRENITYLLTSHYEPGTIRCLDT